MTHYTSCGCDLYVCNLQDADTRNMEPGPLTRHRVADMHCVDEASLYVTDVYATDVYATDVYATGLYSMCTETQRPCRAVLYSTSQAGHSFFQQTTLGRQTPRASPTAVTR
jgi:hypothetical protein